MLFCDLFCWLQAEGTQLLHIISIDERGVQRRML
jgi:hypothetical protein